MKLLTIAKAQKRGGEKGNGLAAGPSILARPTPFCERRFPQGRCSRLANPLEWVRLLVISIFVTDMSQSSHWYKSTTTMYN